MESCDEEVARIFNIQRFSLNDGQGIRTVVFFKGCPHTCPWCANPESMSPRIQTLRRQSKCLGCARCQQDVAECPSGAWEQIGRDMTLDNLLQEVLKDEVFFRASGGGSIPAPLPSMRASASTSRSPSRRHTSSHTVFCTE